ncbi:exodeoxyribonuclease III [Halothiobacillus sp. DCM-1]|uniref:exodeoxyribonuclease III n=1 Tax=Halothiobacillus sp. DCM-1 TaxID=3112558 RepID=UPI00324A7C0A
MRVISFNANGIRSAASKGFFTWLATQSADFVCIQETKAQPDQLTDALFHPLGYTTAYVSAEKKGYSGVAIYARQAPQQIHRALDLPEFDAEGRYVAFEYPNLLVASLYLPSGSAGDHRQASKDRFLIEYLPKLAALAAGSKPVILCGDWNIAHRAIDLKNWRSNQKNSGFLPHERAFLDRVFGELGLVDAQRHLLPDTPVYTWWSNRANAWANDVGWRIDYQIISPVLAPCLTRATVYRAEKFSDHAPLIIDYAPGCVGIE